MVFNKLKYKNTLVVKWGGLSRKTESFHLIVQATHLVGTWVVRCKKKKNTGFIPVDGRRDPLRKKNDRKFWH